MKRAARIGATAALAVALFVFGGIGLFRVAGTGSDGPAVQPGSDELLGAPVIATGSLAQTIASLQERLRGVPTDWRSFASLGLAYVAQARVTADPNYYPKAEGVLQQSLAIDGSENYQAMVGMGALALARHDFTGALQWGEKAKAIDPYNVAVYGVIGDALNELGRYRAAFRTFEEMENLKPGVAAYSRTSYARELQGSPAGAIRAMQAARDASSTQNDTAWADYQLGELFFNSGRLEDAERAYRAGVRADATYVPPHAGLAKVAWARGRIEQAIRGYTWVTERYPLPEYVIALGDLYSVSGQTQQADQQYALVRAEEQLFRANGVNVDLELALFDADHGDPQAALDAATAEWARRHSIFVADALGWALYHNGEYSRAATFARRALHLGTRNALLFFHAGMIQLKLGHERAARELLQKAVDANPRFSILWAPVAERTLARLGGGA